MFCQIVGIVFQARDLRSREKEKERERGTQLKSTLLVFKKRNACIYITILYQFKDC